MEQKLILLLVISLAAAAVFMKFFTAEVHYEHATGVALVVLNEPSTHNIIVLDEASQLSQYIVLVKSEHVLPGEMYYRFITNWAWLVILPFCLVLIVGIALGRRN